ncbi:MAG: hypothetical protein ABI557_11580, partial [Aureliella sp.]
MNVLPSFSCNRLVVVALTLCLFVSTKALHCLFAQDQLGAFEHASDIGDVGKPGNVNYDAESGIYTIAGGGENMWG